MILAMLLTATLDAGTVCVPPEPDAQVKVKLKAGSTVEDLARFASATLCEPWRASPKVATRKLTLAVDGEIAGRQVRGLVGMLAEATGSTQFRGAIELVDPSELPGLAPPAFDRTACKEIPAGSIVAVDPWTRELKRNVLDQILVDGNCLSSEARLVPAFRNGVADGFKLFAIRPNSVLAQLGFQNGDLVQSVNEVSLSAPDKALEAYARVKDAPVIKFAILRLGEPRTIVLNIR